MFLTAIWYGHNNSCTNSSCKCHVYSHSIILHLLFNFWALIFCQIVCIEIFLHNFSFKIAYKVSKFMWILCEQQANTSKCNLYFIVIVDQRLDKQLKVNSVKAVAESLLIENLLVWWSTSTHCLLVFFICIWYLLSAII